MPRPKHFDSKPRPENVLEISRRIKSGQRPRFEFTRLLGSLINQSDVTFRGSPEDVRVNLISRYDNVNPNHMSKFINLGTVAITEALEIRKTSTCDEFSTLSLKPPVLSNKGDGWQVIEQPIAESDYAFEHERAALMNQIDTVAGEEGSIWYPEVPTLQVVEFKASPTISKAILEYVTLRSPQETEVFEASIRFRQSVLAA